MIYYAKSKPMGQWLAATRKGLCFVGRENGEKEEMLLWIEKKKQTTESEENETKMFPYIHQLEDYFKGATQSFHFPLDIKSTQFETAVWKQLLTIPYGKTASYSDIAEKIGQPKAVRAVGRAVGTNPLLIVIPCHRVISKSGKLTGYRGGMAMKEKLLQHEGININKKILH